MVTLNEKGTGVCSNISIRKRSFIIKIGKGIKSLSLVGAVVAGLSVAGVAKASTVTVNAGDTVSEIALANGTTVSQIKKDNNLDNVNLIFVGDKLKVNEAGKIVNTQSAQVKKENTAPVKETKAKTTPVSQASQSSPSQSSSVVSQPTQSSSSSATQPTQSYQSSVQAPQSVSSTPKASYTGSSVSTSDGTLSDSEAQAVANQMAARTGQSASYWRTIMWRESNNQVHAANPSSSARGLFQQLHGGTGSVQEQMDNAVDLYHEQGTQAWALTSD